MCLNETAIRTVDMRNISRFLFVFKTIKITENNLMLFQYFFAFRTIQILSFLLKNIILHQKLHIVHQKNFSQFFEFFDFPDTLIYFPIN